MTGPAVQFFTAPDGVRLAWREMGSGSPVLLIHGFISDGVTNWISYGTASRLVGAGFRCIMPDLRGHGASDKPHDPRFYPADILADDQFALVRHLDLQAIDIVGYSLGARTTARMLARGFAPRRTILSGMGLAGLVNTQSRGSFFRNMLRNLGKHERGSREWMAEAFLKTTGGDAVALDLVLDTFVDTPEDQLRGLAMPIGVICGEEDEDNGSAEALAEVLPNGSLIPIPGNHMSAVTRPEFGSAIASYLM